jgi:hypothetical protein
MSRLLIGLYLALPVLAAATAMNTGSPDLRISQSGCECGQCESDCSCCSDAVCSCESCVCEGCAVSPASFVHSEPAKCCSESCSTKCESTIDSDKQTLAVASVCDCGVCDDGCECCADEECTCSGCECALCAL